MNISFTRVGAPALLMAALAFGCSSSDTNDGRTDGSADHSGAASTDPAHDGAGMNNTDNTATGTMNGTANGTGSSDANATPAQERMNTMTDMNGLRATLLADLEAVRDRLNVGTMPKEQKVSDTELAAELAQGLERVDRALAAMNASTDATWAQIRASQKKEVEEVRTWMAGYKARNEASARK
ncbi:MAG TPA: hypothetical protein VGE21_11815 [Flavobacteriales bacterium]